MIASATLKTNSTPEIITKILTRAAADGVVIHLPQTSEDEISFLYFLIDRLTQTKASAQSCLSD